MSVAVDLFSPPRMVASGGGRDLQVGVENRPEVGLDRATRSR